MEEWRLVADRFGVASTADLARAGLGTSDVSSLVGRGELTRLARGWYALGVPATPERRHVLVTRAQLRAHEGRAVGAHHSGLLVMGLPTFRADLSRVYLARRTPGPTTCRPGLALGRAVPAEAQLDDTVVPALAVVQHGLSGGALSALVAADAALHRRLLTSPDLATAVGWVHQHPKSAAVKAVLTLADGRRESPGETRLAYALHLMKVPATPQFRVAAPGFTAFVDFLVDGENVIIEFDGKVKYGREADEPDPYGNRRSPKEVLWAEKTREDRLRELGYEVVRVVWADLDDLAALAARIGAALRRARARRLASVRAR